MNVVEMRYVTLAKAGEQAIGNVTVSTTTRDGMANKWRAGVAAAAKGRSGDAAYQTSPCGTHNSRRSALRISARLPPAHHRVAHDACHRLLLFAALLARAHRQGNMKENRRRHLRRANGRGALAA
jgi:hypothetical protein